MVLLLFPFFTSPQIANTAESNGSLIRPDIPRVVAAFNADSGVILKPHVDFVTS
ncbi:hypothetical protein CUJ84_pRLN2000064 (plasmid) [Rhizobium leguminosarum]|uniref:Uncharacterized protein n=1 Tax=Rhizobium leguminosarum TaxID=384 RepID=A0A2K9ZEZ2_RHILE|nr:hypothetical protein CUJ84_pRLN2000064 [Rhizobium leguminosarum]